MNLITLLDSLKLILSQHPCPGLSLNQWQPPADRSGALMVMSQSHLPLLHVLLLIGPFPCRAVVMLSMACCAANPPASTRPFHAGRRAVDVLLVLPLRPVNRFLAVMTSVCRC